jgi:Phosphodiester glycosidase
MKTVFFITTLLGLIIGCDGKKTGSTQINDRGTIDTAITVSTADTIPADEDWFPARISGEILDAHGPTSWITVEEGIEFVEVDSAIWVFKIDPKFFRFKIAKHDSLDSYYVPPSGYKQLPDWGRGINLNMFTYSNLPNGYTKVDGVVLQPEFNKYNMFLVWNDEEFKMLDRREEDISDIEKYPNVSQNERMISARGSDRNKWSVNERYWSVATIGVTNDGKVLLIHSRQPYTMHNFIDVMLSYNELLNIKQMAYAEGGPESSIYINEQYQRMGSFETGFNEFYDNDHFWELPFALTFEKK